MEQSRSSTPEAPPQDLWSSILDSVSSSRSIPSKSILLLGEPSSGKSTIASALLQKQVDTKDSERNFALGYDWANVRDEADEDTIARLSVYSVPSSSPVYLGLLPHFLQPQTALHNTVVIIALDWTKPWAFVEQLQQWLQWVEKWAKGDGSREVVMASEESREKLQYYIQSYAEPNSETAATSTATVNNTLLPLGSGTLTNNTAGLPIIVACTKADLIDEGGEPGGVGPSGMGGMVKGKGSEWEERTDNVMQILRTVCLKYGAALFYTTQTQKTLASLRQYALHLSFLPPPPPPPAPGETVVPVRNPFPFTRKPNLLDRDHIFVPIGWDSWGKIAVLRDGFDARSWGDAWEKDIDPEGQGVDQNGSGDKGANKMFASLVQDRGAKPPPLPAFTQVTPEQNFLAKHYEENAKKSDRDPRASFRNPEEGAGVNPAGLVGPLGSSSFNLPNVERALVEMDGGPGSTVTTNGDTRKASRREFPGRPANILSTMGAQPSAPSPTAHARPATSPMATSPSAQSGQSQHEVLHNFFQSLLNTRERGGAAPAPKSANASTASETESNGPGGKSE